MNRLESIIAAYWEVGAALRHPDAPALSAEKALKSLNASDQLRPQEHFLRDNIHTLRFDIIEGNSAWRQKAQGYKPRQSSILTLDVGNGKTT